MKKCYETVWEIFNKCANNQILEDGTIVYDIDATGTKERFSFTEV